MPKDTPSTIEDTLRRMRLAYQAEPEPITILKSHDGSRIVVVGDDVAHVLAKNGPLDNLSNHAVEMEARLLARIEKLEKHVTAMSLLVAAHEALIPGSLGYRVAPKALDSD